MMFLSIVGNCRACGEPPGTEHNYRHPFTPTTVEDQKQALEVVAREAGWNPAPSPGVGQAQGLMQITPTTYRK